MKNQIAFIFLVCFFSHSALACACRGGSDNAVKDVTVSYKNSIAVVKAIARSVEATHIPMDFTQGKATQVKAELTTFEVTKNWKGIKTKTFLTKIATECCVCGISFEIGKEYLLYLSLPIHLSDSESESAHNGYYSTSTCSRTRSIEKAAEDEKILNKITKNKFSH
jgi:hypothetical protein